MAKRDPSEEYVDFDLPEPEIGLEGDGAGVSGFDFRESLDAHAGRDSGGMMEFHDSSEGWSDDRVKELEEWEGRLGPDERRLTWFLACVMMGSLMGVVSAIVIPTYLRFLPVNLLTILLCFGVGAVAGLVIVIPALRRWVG